MTIRTPIAAAAMTMTFLAASCTGGSSNPLPSSPPTASPPASSSPIADLTPPPGHVASLSEADFQFTPARIVIGVDQDLRIVNAGPSLHNVSVAGTQVDLDTAPAQTTETEAIGGALAPGSYTFFCKYHRGRGMVGVIIVVAS